MSHYAKFVPAGEENKRTVWHIFLPGIEAHVGEVRWHDKASRYVFFPKPHVWLDCHGLRLIAEYCDRKTQAQMVA